MCVVQFTHMAIKKKAAPKRTSKKDTYSLSLTLGDKTYKGTGDTVVEALNALKPEKLTYKGLLRAQKGERVKEMLIGVHNLRKMFAGSRLMNEVYAKKLSFLLG